MPGGQKYDPVVNLAGMTTPRVIQVCKKLCGNFLAIVISKYVALDDAGWWTSPDFDNSGI
jgi:hypothetical protein